MENNMNDLGQLAGSASRQYNQMTPAAGDFMNSGELNSSIEHFMQSMMGGSNAHMGQVPQAANVPNPNGAMPAMTPAPSQIGAMPGATQAQGQTAHAQQYGNSMSAPIASNASVHVLQEICTLSQPLNGSLRNTHSIGSYYFLTGGK